MAVVTGIRTRILVRAIPALALLALANCIFAIYIGLEAYEEDGAVWFDDPNRSWFTGYCLRYVTVTELGDGDQASRIIWNASAATSQCLADFPFRYGVLETRHDAERFTPPEELQLGKRYEIEVELSNGAGSGNFTIAKDGTILNEW